MENLKIDPKNWPQHVSAASQELALASQANTRAGFGEELRCYYIGCLSAAACVSPMEHPRPRRYTGLVAPEPMANPRRTHCLYNYDLPCT